MLLEMDVTQATQFLATVQITASTTSSIHVAWEVGSEILPFIKGYQVHFQKVASKYVQYGPMMESTSRSFNIENLVADTYYKVCLVMYRNDTMSAVRDCVDASTTNWHIPVSIGSSIGAVLALSMIVLMVLLSRCPSVVKWRGKQYKKTQNYDSMSSHYHDEHFEFSDTATHGHDDEFVSEIDPGELSNYESSVISNYRREHLYDKYSERLCNGGRSHGTSQQNYHPRYNGARPKLYIPNPQHPCSHHHHLHHLHHHHLGQSQDGHQHELGAYVCSHHGVQGHVCMGEPVEVSAYDPSSGAKLQDCIGGQGDLNHNCPNTTLVIEDTDQQTAADCDDLTNDLDTDMPVNRQESAAEREKLIGYEMQEIHTHPQEDGNYSARHEKNQTEENVV